MPNGHVGLSDVSEEHKKNMFSRQLVCLVNKVQGTLIDLTWNKVQGALIDLTWNKVQGTLIDLTWNKVAH